MMKNRLPLLRRGRTETDIARSARLTRAFKDEEYAGFRFAIIVRSTALCFIGAWLSVSIPWPRVSYFVGFVALFLITGLIAEWCRRRSRFPVSLTALFIFVDACLLTYVLIAPNPFSDSGWPIQVTLRLYNHLYLFLFLILSALSYSPFLVIWTGVSVSIAWSAGVGYIRSLPDTVTVIPFDAPPQESLQAFLSPYYLDQLAWSNQVALILIASMVIAAAVWRARRLVRQQVTSEEARTNLSRYFSPNVVERLSQSPTDLGPANSQSVAILFVDVVGFTELSERLSPDELMSQARDFHRRMVEQVFKHHGTVDKFMGDCVMATFGTPLAGDRDATNALQCAIAIVREIDDWNAERQSAGQGPIRVGVGVHFGEVVVGNVGAESRLEFTVMGDPVNVGSRLERLTRNYQTPVIVSNDLIRRIREESAESENLIALFSDLGTIDIRGRHGSIHAWRYASAPGIRAIGSDNETAV